MPCEIEPATSFCTSCGLCCDGTLFDFVTVDEAEKTVLPSETFALQRKHGRLGFALSPCPMLSGTVCTIYATRPRTCRTFRCMVLMRLNSGGIDVDSAEALVVKARTALARVAAMMAPGETMAAARERWRDYVHGNGNPQFQLHMTQLQLLLDQEFRDKAHQHTASVADG